MTQDERWLEKYNEVKDFIEKNHRNPSKHRIEEHLMLNFIKHNRKLINKEEMKCERDAQKANAFIKEDYEQSDHTRSYMGE